MATNGPEFFQTMMGSRFFQHTMPELVRQLGRVADQLEQLQPHLLKLANPLVQEDRRWTAPGSDPAEVHPDLRDLRNLDTLEAAEAAGHDAYRRTSYYQFIITQRVKAEQARDEANGVLANFKANAQKEMDRLRSENAELRKQRDAYKEEARIHRVPGSSPCGTCTHTLGVHRGPGRDEGPPWCDAPGCTCGGFT